MGKGDKRTKKGKINIGSFGNVRPHKKKEPVLVKKTKKATAAKPKKELSPKAKKPTVKKTTAKKPAVKKPAVKKAAAKKG